METNQNPVALIEKERIRAQINVDVDEFLRRGGQIDVSTNQSEVVRTSIKCAWRDQEDFSQHSY